MDEKLKRRLVGAIVLVSLAVIFVPMLLEEEPVVNSGITESNIPPRPISNFSSRILPRETGSQTPPAQSRPKPPIKSAVSAPKPHTELGSGASKPKSGPAPKPKPEPKPETASSKPKPEAKVAKPTPKQKPEPKAAKLEPKPEATTPTSGLNTQPSAGQTRTGLSAWVVQVASFGERKNAEKLVKQLIAKKLPAFMEQASVEGKTVFRVRVGPEIDKKKAEKIAALIEKVHKLKSKLRRYP